MKNSPNKVLMGVFQNILDILSKNIQVILITRITRYRLMINPRVIIKLEEFKAVKCQCKSRISRYSALPYLLDSLNDRHNDSVWLTRPAANGISFSMYPVS